MVSVSHEAMCKFKHLIFLGFFLLITASFVKAQDVGSDAGELWKSAQTAFGSGDYPQAATLLEKISHISSADSSSRLDNVVLAEAPPNRQWLEPVFFVLGAAYFNAKDWPHAISTFDKYRQLFPKSTRLPQVTFSLAQAYLQGDQPKNSIPLFTSLLPDPAYHAKAVLSLAEAKARAGSPDEAVSILEREKATPDLDPNFLEKINIRLASLYLDNHDDDKVAPLIREINAAIDHVEDVVQFNGLAVRLGDELLKNGDIPAALSCYRTVRSNTQIIALQNRQIQILQSQRAANVARIQTSPLTSAQVQAENKDIDAQIARDQSILTAYQSLPPVLPPLFLRIGRAYNLAGEYWEAAVVYREILRRYPACPQADAALYGSIVVFDRLHQTERALDLCQTYLTRYPGGKYADSVAFLRGAMAYDAQEYDKAFLYFNDCLKTQPANPRREQIELVLGDIDLARQKFDEAIESYKQYEKDFPEGAYWDQADYRSALGLLFAGKSDDANAAINAYLQKYPKGLYRADAEYRLAVIKFGNKLYDEVIADGQNWQLKYGEAAPLAEMLSLMGDCYASEDKNEDAVDSYIRSYKAAQTVQVLNYSIVAAAKILQKQAKWADIVTLFQEFVKANPDHPTVVTAVGWIGRADIRLGKAEEAKKFLAATAKQYLNDPSREAVDEIITQLAQLFAHPHLTPGSAPVAAAPAVPPGAQPANNAPTVGLASSPVPPDPAQELEDILTIPDLASQPTARARLLFAKAELARLQRRLEVQKQDILEMAKEFKPEDLSPMLLGQAGDALMQNAQAVQAALFYHYLIDEYGGSSLVDYGYNGLGQIAYAQKDYKGAEDYFSKALDGGLAVSKLKEITLGQAETLLALGRPDEAKPFFEQVASTRAWRGEATALSVFSLGEIQMAHGKYAEANAYYQRVFVAYQKYPAIQVKAYLKSGEAFEKLGKVPEAINTYSEMLKSPDFSSYPEGAVAKQRLQQLTAK
jgi:TolA-binding protein